MDEALDGVPGGVIAHLPQHGTDNGRDLGFMQAGDLTSYDDLPLGGQHFAGHTGEGVMGKAVIQNTVGYEVAQLIRVALRDGFGGVKLIHGVTSLSGKRA